MTTETATAPTTTIVRHGGELEAIPSRTWHLDIIDGPVYYSAGGNGKPTRWRVTKAVITARWKLGKWSMDVNLEGNSVLASGRLGSATKHIYEYNTEAERLAEVAALRTALAEEYRPKTVIEITENGSVHSTVAADIDDARFAVLTKLMMSDEIKALGGDAKAVIRAFRQKFRVSK
jgi:hypothetical protein